MHNLRQLDRDGMRYRRLALVAVLLLTIALLALPAPAREAEDARSALRQLSSAFTQVTQDAMPAVVFIQVEKTLAGGQSPFGYNTSICLAQHFSNASTVTLADNREFEAKLTGADPKSDVAVIKIKGDKFPALPIGDSKRLAVGEWVMAIGNPSHSTAKR